MPIRKVIPAVGAYYHIYNRAVADNLLFMDNGGYQYFLSKVKKYLLGTADLLAYCLMPNHYHLLIELKQLDLPSVMQKIALSYIVPFNKRYHRSGHLFQGRYQLKEVDDVRYLLHLSRYIHLNPVTAKLINRARDWEHSSLKQYLGIIPMDFVNCRVVLDFLLDDEHASLATKQSAYESFIADWDPSYMSFKEK